MMNPKLRHKARELALQAVYQWQFNADAEGSLIAQFSDFAKSTKYDEAFFIELLQGILANYKELDAKMTPFLDRPITELNPIELAVLRLALYELMYNLETPYKVVINEALELAKTFGSQDGFKYVNGVLDKAAKEIRVNE
jgi:N utilization substance protein B